mgnify:CR=1 FL=1
MPETAMAPENRQQEAIDHVNYWPVEATIWRFNDTASGIVSFAATIEKNYKIEGDGGQTEYKKTAFLSERDLPLASKALNDAHTRIQHFKAQQRVEKPAAKASQAGNIASGGAS